MTDNLIEFKKGCKILNGKFEEREKNFYVCISELDEWITFNKDKNEVKFSQEEFGDSWTILNPVIVASDVLTINKEKCGGFDISGGDDGGFEVLGYFGGL